jgi:hypothetical protein
MNTKTIARLVGTTAAHVNETARDLHIQLTYRADLRRWETVNRSEGKQLLEFLQEG